MAAAREKKDVSGRSSSGYFRNNTSVDDGKFSDLDEILFLIIAYNKMRF